MVCCTLWDLDRMQCRGIRVQRSRLSCTWISFLEKHCFDCLLPNQMTKSYFISWKSKLSSNIRKFSQNIFTIHSCTMQLIVNFWNYVMVQIHCAAVPNHGCKVSTVLFEPTSIYDAYSSSVLLFHTIVKGQGDYMFTHNIRFKIKQTWIINRHTLSYGDIHCTSSSR